MIPLAIVIAYLVSVTAVGSLLARRATDSRQWAVAGGGMGLAMLAAGVAGTRIGGAGTYGVAGNVATGGVWHLWWYAISTFLALALMGALFAIPYRRLGLQTVGEAFRIRFGSGRAQALTSLCVQTEYLVVNVIEAYVVAVILRSLTGMPMLAGVLVAALLIVSYTALGGLWGAAVTNLVHCAAIVLGLLAVGVIGLERLGGWEAMALKIDAQLARTGADRAAWWSFSGAAWGPILGMVFSAAIHTPAASIYTNFSTAARSDRLLLPGFLLAGALAALMPLLAGLVGMETLARFGPGQGLRGYANITAFAMDLDPWVGGVALAAILAAVISSGGPVLLSSATMFVRDWLPFTRGYSPARRLRAYRLTTVVYGLLAALAAWAASRTSVSLLDLLLLAYAMVVPPAIAVGYLIYWKRTTEAGAFWGIAVGYVGGLLWYAFDRPPFVAAGHGLDPSYATTLLPLAIVPLVSLLAQENVEGREPFYSRLAGGSVAPPEA